VLYTNPQTGIRVVYDPQGNYFRVEDPSARSEVDRYLDQNGQRLPQNVPLVGQERTTQTGVPRDVRKALTHFKNSDPKPEGSP
jgi:filamentous hemagglutinin